MRAPRWLHAFLYGPNPSAVRLLPVPGPVLLSQLQPPVQVQPVKRQWRAADLCRWCGGAHVYECPRIRRAEFYDTPYEGGHGAIRSVEFDPRFAEALWEQVEWPEEVSDGGT